MVTAITESYTLYLDASGDSGWYPPYGKSNIKYYVVAGLALSPMSNIKAYQSTEQIIEKYLTHGSNVENCELCYHDLIYGNKAFDPKLLAIRSVIHRFAMSMKRENAVGTVTMDAEEYRKDYLIQEMVRTFKKIGIIIRGFNYDPVSSEKISNIVDTINFTDSKMSAGIQLADFCARSTWQHFENGKSRRFIQLSSLWDRYKNTVYEPVVFPK